MKRGIKYFLAFVAIALVGSDLEGALRRGPRGITSWVSQGVVASPFDPANVTGLQRWYDASDAGTITESGGDISQWDDKSIVGSDLVQATGARQPDYLLASQNTLNVVDFDNIQIEYIDGAYFDVNAGTGFSLYIALKQVTTGNRIPINVYNNTTQNRWRLQYNSTPTIIFQMFSDGSNFIGRNADDAEVTTGIWQVFGISWDQGTTAASIKMWNSSNAQIDVSDSNSGTYTGTPAASTAPLRVGGRGDNLSVARWGGGIGEIILADDLHSETERGEILSYLAGRWE